MAVGGSSDARIVKALVAAGARVDAKTGMTPHDNGGETPLHLAVRRGAGPATVEALLEAGAEASVQDGSGYTPLFRARGAVAELLLDAGVDVRSRDGLGHVHRTTICRWLPCRGQDLTVLGAEVPQAPVEWPAVWSTSAS